MADYISQSDLDAYLSDTVLMQLTDDDDSGSIDAAIVAECIVAAEAEVNTYLAARYTTPITGTIPEIVVEWCVILCVHRLYLRRQSVPEAIDAQAQVARAQLKLMADGTISLDIGTSGADEPSSREAEFQYVARTASRGKFEGW